MTNVSTDRLTNGYAVSDDFRTYADDLPLFVWTQLPDGTITWVNRTWYERSGLAHEDATSTEAWRRVFHPADYDAVVDAFGRAIDRRETFEVEYRFKPAGAPDDAYRLTLARATPRFGPDGDVRLWIGTAVDVHDARARALERADLDGEFARREAETLRMIADTVPQMMWTARPDGWIDWYNRRWYEYTGQTQEEAAGWGWQAAHHPQDLPRVLERWPASIATGEPFEMEFRLRDAGGVFRMFLTRANPMRDADGAIVRWYGSNTDIDAEYEARMRDRRIATSFQAAALQPKLPVVPGLVFDALYRPGQSEALVGGDWYDAFRLLDGRLVISVGDVGGSGLHAAVTMASLRQSIRTAALIDADPVAVLDAADRILRDIDVDRFATAFVGVYDPIQAELRYASAGHPPALLRGPTGTIEILAQTGVPLGSRLKGASLSPAAIDVAVGSLLLVYTDGLTEFDRDIVRGEAALAAAYATVAAGPRTAHAIYDAVLGTNPLRDDIAIFSAFFEAPFGANQRGSIVDWRFDANDAVRATSVRREFADALLASDVHPDDVAASELVLGELIGNVVRHARGPLRVTLDRTNEKPVLHVLDDGGGFEHDRRLPPDALAEHGRGLFIVSHFADEVSIARRRHGGSHTRAVLSGRVRRLP